MAALSFLDLPGPLRDGVLLGLNSGVSELKEEALNIAQRFTMSPPILDAVSSFAKMKMKRSRRVRVPFRFSNHEKPLSDTSLAFLTKLVIDKDAPVLLGRQAAQALAHCDFDRLANLNRIVNPSREVALSPSAQPDQALCPRA